jgi:transketolase
LSDLDRCAIDTVRVLAMDTVQKAGNGHLGTAMSLAPTAYLLFQSGCATTPGDPNRVGRDRFVLSMGHSSLTWYIQLFVGFWLLLIHVHERPGRRSRGLWRFAG